MKKTYQRLPESELDIMLVLWNGTPPMTRPEIEKVINTKKKLASTTINSVTADQTGEQKFCGSDETGKNEFVYTVGFAGRLSGARKSECS